MADRAKMLVEHMMPKHDSHSPLVEFPQNGLCMRCGNLGSWQRLGNSIFSGDPLSVKTGLPNVEPEFFRKGAGLWGGKPTW